jgi:hypothetical protein
MLSRSLTSPASGQLVVDPCPAPRQIQKPESMIAHALHSFATASRFWFRLELTRIARRAEDFASLRLPVFDDPFEAGIEARHAAEREDRIAPTAIVLIGLVELIFVAFLVGQTYGGLHPVWKVIVTLAGIGIAGFSFRLMRLLKARKARQNNGVTAGAPQ